MALLGTNGNGKSTLIKCIMGLVRPARGRLSLSIDGMVHDLTRLTPEQIVDLGVALVPEGRRLFPKLTVVENLMLGAFRKAARSAIQRNLATAFETFPVLEERKNQLAGTMSGGQQQMLAIGRGLASSPKLLMLDEPSMGLAPSTADFIFERLIEIRRQSGLTMLLVEQRVAEALESADHGYVLEAGRVVLEGNNETLRADDRVRKAYLGM